MMKKVIALTLASVMALSMAACGSSAASTADSAADATSVESAADSASDEAAVETGVEDGVLTVGFDAEYPPYGYMDETGEYTGFDLELAEAVCEKEGWTLEKKPINWDSKDMELNSGAIDCIWNGFTKNGREEDYTFSVSYVDNSQVIVVAENSGIATLADLADKTVGVQQASAALDVLTSDESDQKALGDSFKEIKQFADYNTAFTELQAGSLDALAIDIGVAKYQLNSRGTGFMMLEEALNTEEYAVAFRKGDTALADIIDKDLKELAKDGVVAQLGDKYEIGDMISLTAE